MHWAPRISWLETLRLLVILLDYNLVKIIWKTKISLTREQRVLKPYNKNQDSDRAIGGKGTCESLLKLELSIKFGLFKNLNMQTTATG